MRKLILLICLFAILGISGCAPKVVEVIKTVEIPVEKIVTVPVEITREVPVIQTVEVVQTVIVTKVVPPTPRPPTATPEALTDVFAFNWLGEIESKGVKLELGRVLCGSDSSIERLGTSFVDIEEFDKYDNACMFVWRITNNSSKPIKIQAYDAYAMIGTSQANLADLDHYTAFGSDPTDAIMPGVVAVSGFWFPIKNMPVLPAKVSLRLDRMIDPDTYRNVTGFMTIDAQTPTDMVFEELPEELE